eukprot:2952826-Amphidinium_carterae.2
MKAIKSCTAVAAEDAQMCARWGAVCFEQHQSCFLCSNSFQPTYEPDARVFPYPFGDKDLLVDDCKAAFAMLTWLLAEIRNGLKASITHNAFSGVYGQPEPEEVKPLLKGFLDKAADSAEVKSEAGEKFSGIRQPLVAMSSTDRP